MTTITTQLADALRATDEFCQAGLNSSDPKHWEAALQDIMQSAREALAAYDAQQAVMTTCGHSKYDPCHNCEPVSGHTPEPWQEDADCGDSRHRAIYDTNGRKLGLVTRNDDDARRIVACVNACAGTSTEKLESGRYGIVKTVFGD